MAGSLYDLLGVAPDASAEALRAAHRERARQLHPDRATGDVAAMRTLNEAWSVLSDPARRAAYDRLVGATDRAAAGDPGDPDGTDETGPAPPGAGIRLRLWPLLVVGAGLLVVVTAYAGRPADSRTQVEPVGQCLVEGADVDRTRPCRSAGGSRIVAVGGPGVQCPAGTDARALRGSRDQRKVCLARVAGR